MRHCMPHCRYQKGREGEREGGKERGREGGKLACQPIPLPPRPHPAPSRPLSPSCTPSRSIFPTYPLHVRTCVRARNLPVNMCVRGTCRIAPESPPPPPPPLPRTRQAGEESGEVVEVEQCSVSTTVGRLNMGVNAGVKASVCV